MNEITIDSVEYIELLEYKLQVLKDANELDSSWNYGIDELEFKINKLKSKIMIEIS